MALDPNKTDAILGEAIKELLTDAGVETPILGSALSDQNKIDSIRDDFAHIMRTLGLDMTDDSLKILPDVSLRCSSGKSSGVSIIGISPNARQLRIR